MDGGEVPSQRRQDELFDTPAKGVGRRELARHFASTEQDLNTFKRTQESSEMEAHTKEAIDVARKARKPNGRMEHVHARTERCDSRRPENK